MGEVSSLSSIQSEEAVNSAQRAFERWSQKLPGERAKLLRRWYELILEHRSDLAQIMVAEQGKPLSEALGEIDYAASFVEFYAEEAKRPNIEGVTSHLDNAEVELWREPSGYVHWSRHGISPQLCLRAKRLQRLARVAL